MGKEQELLDAARNGQVDVVDKILSLRLKKGNSLASLRKTPGPNVQDASGYTALHFASLNGHRDVVRILLQHDANVNIVDKKGCSPLHLASWAGHYDIVNFILMQSNIQPNINLVNNDNETALHCAAQFNHHTTVELLLMNGVDIELRNSKDETAFDLACEYGRFETVRVLLEFKPDLVFTSNHICHTPLHLAAKNGHCKIIKLLLNANFDVNCVTENGSALHEAVFYGRVDIVRILLDYGIDTSLVNKQGKNVFDLLEQLNTGVSRTIESIIENYALNNQRIKNSNSPLNKSSSLHFIQPPEKFTDKHSEKHHHHNGNHGNHHHVYNDDNHHYLNTGELVAYATEASQFNKQSSSTNIETYVQPPKQFAQQSTNHYLEHNNSKFNSSQRPNRRKVSPLNCESKLNKNNFSRSQDSILDDYLTQNQYEQPSTAANYQQIHKKKQKPQLSTFVQHPVVQSHHHPHHHQMNKMISSDYATDDLYSSLEEPEPIYSYPSSSYINDNQPHSLQNNYLEQHYTDQIQPYSSFDPTFNYHKSNACSSSHNLNRKQEKVTRQQSFNQNVQPTKSMSNRNSQSHHQLNYLHNNSAQKIYASNISYGNQDYNAISSSGHDSGYSMSTYQTIDRDRNLASNKKNNHQHSSFYDPYSSLNQENQNARLYSGMKRSTSNTSDSYLDNLSTSCSSTKDLASLPCANYQSASGLKNSLKTYSSVVDEFSKLNKTSNLRTKSTINNLPMETVQRVKVQNSNDLYAQVDKTRKNSLKSNQSSSNHHHQSNKIQNLLEFYDQPSKLIKRADSITDNSINHQVANSKVNNEQSSNACKTTNSKMINHLTAEQLELYTEIEKKVKPIKNKLTTTATASSSFDQSHDNESNDAASLAAAKAELRSQATFVKAKMNREKRATIAIALNENELDELNKFEGKPPSAKAAANQISKILQPIHENYKKMKLKPNKQTITDQKQFNKFSAGKKMIIIERNLETSKNLVDKSVGTADKDDEEVDKEDEELDKTIKRQDYDKSKTNDLIDLDALKRLEDRFNEIRSTKDNTSTMKSTTSNASSTKSRRPAPPPPAPPHKTSTLDLSSQLKKDFDTLKSTNSSGSNVEAATMLDLAEKIPNKIDKNLNEKERDLLSKSLNLPLNLDWTHDPLVLYKQTCHYLAFYLGTSKIKNLQNTQFSQKCIRDYRKLLIDNNLPSLTAVILSISYKSVRCVDVNNQKIINEHEIKSIHYGCQDIEHFRFFAYVTKDLEDKSNFNCHVFSAVNLELANEILTTLSQAFEIAFRVSSGETIDQLRKQYVKLKLNNSRSNDVQPNPPPRIPPRNSSYSLDRNLNISKSLSESQFNQLLISASNGFSSNGRKAKQKDKVDQLLKDDHPLKIKQLSASNSIKSIKSVKSESNYLNRRKSLQSNQSFTQQLTSLNNLIKPQKPLKPRPPLKHQTSLPESNISINNKLSILDQTSSTKLSRANLPINKPTVPEKPKVIRGGR